MRALKNLTLATLVTVSSSAFTQPLYKVYPILGPRGDGDVTIRALNNDGTFVGSANTGNLHFKGSRASGYTELQPPSGMANYSVRGITNEGWVCGAIYDFSAAKPLASIWNPSNVAIPMGRPSGMNYATASDVNILGQACGNFGNNNGSTAFRWTQSTGIVPLSSPEGFPQADAFRILEDGTTFGRCSSQSKFTAIKWSPSGQTTVLSPLLGDSDSGLFWANRQGIAVGYSETNDARPVKWINDQPQELALLPATLSGYAQWINNQNIVSGSCYDGANSWACLWNPDGSVINLNDRIDPSTPGWRLWAVACNNDDGVLLGVGRFNGRDYTYFVAEPVAESIARVENVTVNLGYILQGDVFSLDAADGDTLQVAKFIVPNLPMRIQVTVSGRTSFPTLSSLGLLTKGRVSINGSFSQTVELFDFSANRFDPVDWRTDTFGISYLESRLNATGNVNRYRRSDGLIRARYTVAQTGIVASSAWYAEHDVVQWLLRP